MYEVDGDRREPMLLQVISDGLAGRTPYEELLGGCVESLGFSLPERI